MALDSLAPPQAPLTPQPPEPEPAQPPLTGGEVIDFISTLMRLLVPKPVIVTSGRKGFTGILSRADAKIPTSGRQPVGEKSSAGPTQSRTSTSSGRESGNFVGVNSSLKPVTLSPLEATLSVSLVGKHTRGKTRKHIVLRHTRPQVLSRLD